MTGYQYSLKGIWEGRYVLKSLAIQTDGCTDIFVWGRYGTVPLQIARVSLIIIARMVEAA